MCGRHLKQKTSSKTIHFYLMFRGHPDRMVMSVPMPANTNRPQLDQPAEEGGPLAATLARAQAAVADLAKDYAGWALADVARGRAALASAAAEPAHRAEQVEALFRVAHDLKGQGTSFGYPLI